MPRKLAQLLGQRFGKLLVESQADHRGKVPHWNCICDCGNVTTAASCNLIGGKTKSCGCGKGAITHGHNPRSGASPTYGTWMNMLARCNNPNNPKYKYYGGKGIRVCERWRSFENFLADMGLRPPGKTLDRIYNNLGYEPNNCVWATNAEQALNKGDVPQCL